MSLSSVPLHSAATSDNESSSAIGSLVRDNAQKRQPEPMTTDATFTPSIQTVLSQKPQTPNIVYSTYRSAMPHIVTIKKARERKIVAFVIERSVLVKSNAVCGRRCMISRKRDARYVILPGCEFQTIEYDVLQKLTEGASHVSITSPVLLKVFASAKHPKQNGAVCLIIKPKDICRWGLYRTETTTIMREVTTRNNLEVFRNRNDGINKISQETSDHSADHSVVV